MANAKDHDHTAAQDGLVHYRRTTSGELYDTRERVSRGELAVPPQQYVDHAGRPTTVKEYKGGAADVFVGDDQPRYWAKERIVTQAQALASSTDWKSAGDHLEALFREWRSIGPIDRQRENQLWDEFNGARQQFKDARQRHFDARKAEQAAAAGTKTQIATRAETLASSSDTKSAADEMKRLLDQWKAAGHADRDTEQRLWARFDSARKQLQSRRTQEFEKRKAEWAANKSAKEQIVREAESLASGSDLKSSGERMRALSDRWRQIGPCEKADNDRLWGQFTAARNRLNEKKKQAYDRRQQEFAANKSTKERIVSQAESLANGSDLQSAGDAMRSLSDQWRQVGPCDKADNDRLWSRFNAAKKTLQERRQRDFENRKAERRQRAAEQVSRLESQMWNAEAAIIRANESYSRALSARSPSLKNPNYYQIVTSQQRRVSDARDRVVSATNRRNEIVSKLSQARSRLNSL
jgi:hypothetical protein